MRVSDIKPVLLLGPGPSPVRERILEAMAHDTVGHLDPQFLTIMDEVNEGLRVLFGTRNRMTFPVSATGSAGMQASLVNLLEPGDTAIIGVNGVFGGRLAEMARRIGCDVVTVEAEWGRIIPPEEVIEAHKAHPDARVVALVHAETSTGVCQPLGEVGAALRGSATLFVVDAVTSLGGIPVDVDDHSIDVCYSGTQKCLGVPPGLAPITFSEKAMARTESRTTLPQSWYLDVALIAGYLGQERRYHHTAPINSVYALHEGLVVIEEEGLDACFRRHQEVGSALQNAMVERGFSLFAQEGHRLPQLTAVALPDGREEGPLRKALLEDHHIEVGGGLGPGKGKLWRIGLMGAGANHQSVERLTAAVDTVLAAG
ncbi:MAG: alanine--glyoxylate aminotransferase family protein [Gemmatimonadota bacterium]|nr:MAG: alanine--glyoxylate aminotransferase family protein [Gemmatimonadota bacterium]